ncbi:hypothetical protein [Chryseolinea lacunae]|uniref:DUF1735 domain-containing protein n=1 Tax=Chryseolinea lacunae TaxID=2801331 RepID=A0ABS1KK49_9BACT|nr:hypothetical protein [Chryseolinea lacunae]MBL0739607.1 hypothetical protein [Chryseolinea lacunae]
MKAIKGALLFGFSALIAGACFSPPDLPIAPQITYEGDIYFVKGQGVQDSLVVTINFKDGDGDLGLSSSAIGSPYNDINLYLANNGDTIALGKNALYDNLPPLVEVPNGATGKLVSVRTPKDPAYAYLPKFNPAANCPFENFTYDTLYVNEPDRAIFDNKNYKVIDTLTSADPRFPRIFLLLDTFYYRQNPNYANIEVAFYVRVDNTGDENTDYQIYDWRKEFCSISFNQRFPELSSKNGPLEGKLTYAMVSAGISSIFAGKALKLKIRIRDRGLHTSNIIDTGDFTLTDISR